MARRPHRPDVRPAPWKGGGWKDAPGALAVKEVDPARLAEALAASGYRAYRVGVCAVRGQLIGYTSVRNEGECLHNVTAKNRHAALRQACEEHKERCAR